MNVGILSAVLGAVCIAFAPIFVKVSSMPPTTSAFYRCFLAAMAGLMFLLCWQPQQFKSFAKNLFSERRWIPIMFAGLAFSLDLFAWHRSVVYAGAGIATLLANSQVFYLAFIGWIFFKEPLDFKYILLAGLSFSGLFMAVYFNDQVVSTPNYFLGVSLGLLTGLLYSAYIIAVRWSDRRIVGITRLQKLVAISGAAAFFLGILLFFEGGTWSLKSNDWVWALLLALVCQLGGWLLLAKALSVLDLSIVGLIILLQPVLAFAIGHLMLGESGQPMQYLGLVLALLGIFLGERYRRKMKS